MTSDWFHYLSVSCIPKAAPNKYLSAKPWDLSFHPPAWSCMLKCCWSLESFLTACILSLESAMPFLVLYVLPCFLITESFRRLSCRVCERKCHTFVTVITKQPSVFLDKCVCKCHRLHPTISRDLSFCDGIINARELLCWAFLPVLTPFLLDSFLPRDFPPF